MNCYFNLEKINILLILEIIVKLQSYTSSYIRKSSIRGNF